MDQSQFIGNVAHQPEKFAWFLGAGASHSAGLPTAVDLIWDIKRRRYCRDENQGVSPNDLQNSAVRVKIDDYMVSKGFPSTDDPAAYSRTFELEFGTDYERQRQYLRAILSEDASSLTLGHRVLGGLLASGRAKVAFTTNFDTVTVHKNTAFTQEEILGALDAFNDNTQVELVQVVKSANWLGYRYGAQGADNYPVVRGTILPLTKREALLWTQGTVTGVHMEGATRPVYKEGFLKPVPSPLLLRRFTGDGGWHDTCSGILGLTKMDWNNNTLYKKLPVTMEYSSRFAKIIQQNPEMVDELFDFRGFM